MYDNLINRNEKTNHSNSSSLLEINNKSTTDVNHTPISDRNSANGYNRQSKMASDVSNQKKRPLSISSVSSSSSSSCSSLTRNGSLGMSSLYYRLLLLNLLKVTIFPIHYPKSYLDSKKDFWIT